jgi:hypothetical protein
MDTAGEQRFSTDSESRELDVITIPADKAALPEIHLAESYQPNMG